MANEQFVMPFGKYKGEELDTIPEEYLEWLLGWLEDTGQDEGTVYAAICDYLG